MLYFAYGSNMYTPRLRYRVPSANAVAVAQLEGHLLRWHKRSTDGSGKCNAFLASESRLFGVVFELDELEKDALSRAEGVGHGYHEKQITVLQNGQSTP